MAEVRQVLVVCDYCGAEEEEGGSIRTREADAPEGGRFEVEACGGCWTRLTEGIRKKARHRKRRRASKRA